MAEKSLIIQTLGESSLLLPHRLNAALAANDRAKYLLTLLQAARLHAEHPDNAAADLRSERLAAGIDDESWDRLAEGASRCARQGYRIPGMDRLGRQLGADLRQMLAPLADAGSTDAENFSKRLGVLETSPWHDEDMLVGARQIERLTSGDRKKGDSVHLLIMDMHRALNALQARIAPETIEGAKVYEVARDDRGLIAAFMKGVNRTRPLKFDHPGLATTATRSGERLLIQNDIGTTDAHILVVHVEALAVSVTYTDVHLQRLVFFQSLFEDWPVTWEDTRSRTDKALEDGVYHMSVGVHAAQDRDGLERYLDFLGSRLVFLIDWNRARKRLQLLLPKREVRMLLKWAADRDHGHMAFLRAGGEQAIFDAIGYVARSQVGMGTRLDNLLGTGPALDFMRFMLRTCAQGMLAGRPEALIHDEIRAELATSFHSAQQNMIDIAADHAALTLEIACALLDCLTGVAGVDGQATLRTCAERALAWEHRADELVNQARSFVRQDEKAVFYCHLVEIADDVTDDLEDAAFHLTLLADGRIAAPIGAPLIELAGQLVEGGREYLKALETARCLRRGAPREDVQDFLEAVHNIVTCERNSDRFQREVKAMLMREAADHREMFTLAECAHKLESAADALMHAALSLRDHQLGTVLAE